MLNLVVSNAPTQTDMLLGDLSRSLVDSQVRISSNVASDQLQIDIIKVDCLL